MLSQKAAWDCDVCDADRRATAASSTRRSDRSIPALAPGQHGGRRARQQGSVNAGHGGVPTSSARRLGWFRRYHPPRARDAPMEPPAAAQETVDETVDHSVDESVDRREGSSVAVQVSFLLAVIGCVVLYVVVKRWLHRRAVAKARQESEEMQRSPRHFTAEEYAPEPSTPTLASADQSPSPGPSPLQAAAVPRLRLLEAAAPRTQGPRAGRELGRRVLRARGAVPADGRQGRQLRLRHDVAQGGGRACKSGWRAGTVTRPAWRGLGTGVAWAWLGLGTGWPRTWRWPSPAPARLLRLRGRAWRRSAAQGHCLGWCRLARRLASQTTGRQARRGKGARRTGMRAAYAAEDRRARLAG